MRVIFRVKAIVNKPNSLWVPVIAKYYLFVIYQVLKFFRKFIIEGMFVFFDIDLSFHNLFLVLSIFLCLDEILDSSSEIHVSESKY